MIEGKRYLSDDSHVIEVVMRDGYLTEVSRHGKNTGMVKTGKAERRRPADQDHLDLGDDSCVLLCLFYIEYFLIWGHRIISEPGDSSIGRGDRGRAYFRDMVYEKGISREVWVKAKMRNKTGRGLQN